MLAGRGVVWQGPAQECRHEEAEQGGRHHDLAPTRDVQQWRRAQHGNGHADAPAGNENANPPHQARLQ